jgi:lipopolysaccharide/colanic/teichoic acid biosynthesis glycosyltransferase
MSWKRVFDILLSVLAILLVAPIMLAMAAIIKLDSDGPVFFRQDRLGRFGRKFKIIKFRSMHVSSDLVGPKVTVEGDPRITRVGRIIRSCKLDELPQFFNVLVGDMSFVGPRPEVEEFVRLHPPAAREVILSVRPGVTDPASLYYFDESKILEQSSDPVESYITEILPAKRRIYISYVNSIGFRTDMRIIYNTGRYVLLSILKRAFR